MKYLALVLGMASSSLAWAGPAEDWKNILSLDAGPKNRPSSAAEARDLALRHLTLQRTALEQFLENYPRDSRAWEARMRLASVFATLGMTGPDTRQVKAALQLYSSIQQSPDAPAALKADASFRKASLLMQYADPSSAAGRTTIVSAARSFARAYPGDIRAPRILVEAASVCDADPELKRNLLEGASTLTTEASLRARIADDLRRLELLGKPLDLQMPTLNNKKLDLASFRGQPCLLVFWSSESPHSLLWLRDFRAEWQKLTRRPAVLTVSLDTKRSAAVERARSFPPSWEVAYEPGGWDAPTARRLGINALPTVWVLDAEGRLRSLNARTDWMSSLQKLSR